MNYDIIVKGKGSDSLYYLKGLKNMWGDEDSILIYRYDSGDVDTNLKGDMKKIIGALYDELQTNDNLKDGDTFTYRGKVIARADGIHVVPVESYKVKEGTQFCPGCERTIHPEATDTEPLTTVDGQTWHTSCYDDYKNDQEIEKRANNQESLAKTILRKLPESTPLSSVKGKTNIPISLGGDKYSSWDMGNLFSKLSDLGYKEKVDWKDSAADDTITILSQKMADDPDVWEIFMLMGLIEE